jgi:hypothetical protein
MNQVQYRRGSSVVAVIVGIAVVLLIAGGIWYFVSKPFQTHVNQVYDKATQWTPENIKKDPVGYLTWALAEVDKTKDKLDASRLGLATKKNANTRVLKKQSADMSDYENLFKEFKDAYAKAGTEKHWPVTVRGKEFSEKAFKSATVECNAHIANTKVVVDTLTKTEKLIDDKLSEIEAKLSEVEQLKIKLSANLEIANANKSVEDIGSIGDQLNAIVDTSSALAKTTEENSVADMVKPSGDAHVEDEFSKIMGKGK